VNTNNHAKTQIAGAESLSNLNNEVMMYYEASGLDDDNRQY
jgi:hypothetical protein